MGARALMTTEIVSITADAGLDEAARLLVAHGVNALPVVAPDGSVLGVVGIKDVLRSGRRPSAGRDRPRRRRAIDAGGPRP